ncbi:MAG: DUF3102 domain-containing protein [Desulfobacteraceae bacterium]|nr:DUF3102 domain-containing protein [Desulfobacteraceae bacterium]
MNTNEIVKSDGLYSCLDSDTSQFFREKAKEIRILYKLTSRCVTEIGNILISVKEKIGHGHWLPWLEFEFGWDGRTAENFMNVTRKFGPGNFDIENVNIGKSVLYLLASISTPDSAVEEAFERAENGEKITVQKAKEIVRKNKELEKNVEELRKHNMNMNRELENTQDIVKKKDDDVLDLKNQIKIAENDLEIKDSQIKMFEEENSEVDDLKTKIDNYEKLVPKIKDNHEKTIDYYSDRINELEDLLDYETKQEKSVEVIPDDYLDIKDENEELKKKIDLLESRGGISQEKGISAAVNEIEGVFEFLDNNFDLTLIEHDDKDKLRKVLLKIYPYLNDADYEMPTFKMSDKLKLKRAGYTVLRLHDKKINELSNKGGWILHNKYETKKEAENAYKQLIESDMCIGA